MSIYMYTQYVLFKDCLTNNEPNDVTIVWISSQFHKA